MCAFVPTKGPKEMRDYYINAAIIGHVDHGKTTFTSALTKAASLRYPDLNAPVNIDNIDHHPEEKARGITIDIAHIPIIMPDREISIADCPGHRDYIANMISGSSKAEIGILLISAEDGILEQSEQHLNLAATLGIKKIFVVVNKMDKPGAEDLLDLVEAGVDEALAKVGAEKVGMIYISATRALTDHGDKDIAEIDKVLDYLENYDAKSVLEGEDFKMQIDNIFSGIKGQGVIVTGTILSGSCSRGDEVEIAGMGMETSRGTIINLQTFRQDVQTGVRGMDIGLQIRGLNKDHLAKGMSIVKKGKARLVNRISGIFMIAQMDEKEAKKDKSQQIIRATGFGVGFEPQVFIKQVGRAITAKVVQLGDGDIEYVAPGDTVKLTLELKKPAMININDQIIVRESGKTVGQGSVLELLA